MEMNCGYESCGPRSFLTREEKIGMLQEYQQSLESEVHGVKERIAQLRNEN